MRKFLRLSAAAWGLAAGPALAQTPPATPSAPPPAASSGMSSGAPDAGLGMTGMRALRGQQREAVRTHRIFTAHGKPTTHRASAR